MPEITNFGSVKFQTINAYALLASMIMQRSIQFLEECRASGIDATKISKEERDRRFSDFLNKEKKESAKNRRKSGDKTQAEAILSLSKLKDHEGNLISTLPAREEPQQQISFELHPQKGLPFTVNRGQRYETGKLLIFPISVQYESGKDAVIGVIPSSGTSTMLRTEIQTLACALAYFVCTQTGARAVTYEFARRKLRILRIRFELLEQPIHHTAQFLDDLAMYLSEEWEKIRAKTA